MFNQLFEKQLMISMSRQMALNDYLGDNGWGIDIGEGELTIENRGSFPIQLLGTESDQSNTWLWAWANEQSNLPEAVLGKVHQIHQFGRSKGIAELTEATFSLETISAHEIAIVCTALSDTACYYVAGYDGGALYTLIDKVPEQVNTASLERINTVIMQSISQFSVDHRAACLPYLQQQNLQIQETGETIVATRPGQGHLELRFSPDGRLAKIRAQLLGANQETAQEPEPAKKPWWRFW